MSLIKHHARKTHGGVKA